MNGLPLGGGWTKRVSHNNVVFWYITYTLWRGEQRPRNSIFIHPFNRMAIQHYPHVIPIHSKPIRFARALHQGSQKYICWVTPFRFLWAYKITLMYMIKMRVTYSLTRQLVLFVFIWFYSLFLYHLKYTLRRFGFSISVFQTPHNEQ